METTETNERTPLNIFVTAAAAPLGRTVTQRLAADGHKVYGVAKGKDEAAAVRAAGGMPVFADPTRAGEIASALRMAKAHVVIHLAPMSLNIIPLRAVDADPQTLVDGTAALVDGVQAAGGEAFLIHTSFAFLYAPSAAPAGEDAPLVDGETAPLLDAALKAERLVRRAPIKAAVLRAGYVYGPHMPGLADVQAALRAGRPLPAGDNPANWVHSDDLAQAIALAAAGQPAGEVFNIVDDSPVSPSAFVARFAEAQGLRTSGGLPGFMTRFLAGKTSALLLGLGASASNQHAKAALGWQPRYATYASGIDQTLMTWRAEMVVRT